MRKPFIHIVLVLALSPVLATAQTTPIAHFSFDLNGDPGRDSVGGFHAISVVNVSPASGVRGLAGSFAVDMAAEDELEKQLDLGLNIDERFGLNARLGYRFHPHISAEFQLEWIPETDISANPEPDPNFGNDAFNLERVTYMANAKGYLGTGSVQPFLLVGVGLMTIDFKGNKPFNNISSTEEDFAARFGGGIEVYATDNIVVNIDASYVLPAGDLKNFDYLSIGWGFQYRF